MVHRLRVAVSLMAPRPRAPIAVDSFGRPWTAMDACGNEIRPLRHVWTAGDTCGRRLEIYGSEGCEFKSLRGVRNFRGRNVGSGTP